MATMILGSKSEQFHLQDHNWYCSTGLPSDITIEIGEMSFHLHKFPLLSRSGLLEKLIEESSSKTPQPQEEPASCILQLQGIPGGAKAFELIAKFCYAVKIEVTALNVISLRCAAEYLIMTEHFGDNNLIAKTDAFLDQVFSNWSDTIRALESCDVLLPHAEDLLLVSRCIDSLAMKACAADPSSIGLGIQSSPDQDWWCEDVSFLNLALYKRLIQALHAKGMKPERISGSLILYAKRYLPVMNRQSSFKDSASAAITTPSEADQRSLLEEIVGLLPNQKGIISTKFLLRLLRTAMVLHASPSCRENLEKRVGSELEQACLEDLLIPSIGYSVETLHDVDCVQRILDCFMVVVDQDAVDPSMAVTMVANLIDGYLSEVAMDVNLKLPKFQSLAAVIPDYARPTNDSIYHAIDIYLKAHPWLTDNDREQICRLMNCQKLSLEASTHAAQNQRLPLRVIVQVLFFEQLRLRTSISGWFFVSENLENSRNLTAGVEAEETAGDDRQGVTISDMRIRVSELEKECLSMKDEMKKVVRSSKSWSIFPRKCGFGLRSQQLCSPKESQNSKFNDTPSTSVEQQDHRELIK